MTTPIVRLESVEFAWPGSLESVIDVPAFSIERGERVFLQGPSGSGKSTLLSLVAAIVLPQHGTIEVAGTDLSQLGGAARDRFRADHLGFIFQQFNLLPFMSVIDNVRLPCRFSRTRKQRALHKGGTLDEEAVRLLSAMQLPVERLTRQSTMQLSVGQQQRVAVARALIGQPDLIVADEPTSALDTDTRAAFLDLLFRELEHAGSTLLFVSHDVSLAPSFDRVIDLNAINRAGLASDPGKWPEPSEPSVAGKAPNASSPGSHVSDNKGQA